MQSSVATRALSELRQHSRRPLASRRAALAEVFADHLGWGSGAVEPLEVSGEQASAIALAPSDRRLAIAVATEEPFPANRLSSLGYSGEADYAVLWAANGLTLTESARWARRPGDTRVGPLSLDDPAALDLMDVLRPHNVRERLPSLMLKGGTAHDPLHERLAQAFALLRVATAQRAAFQGLPQEDADDALLRIFHQLLYIRHREDNGSAPTRRRVSKALNAEDPIGDVARTLSIYEEALDSELFLPVASLDLPLEPFVGVLSALVAPWSELRLNFSVTRPDLAGRLYESYLANAPAVEDGEPSLFPLLGQRDERRQRASFFTPATVARQLAVRTMKPWLESHKPSSPRNVRVLDPACGSGAFLLAAYRVLEQYFSDQHGRPLSEGERRELLLQSIFGADRDPRAIALARLQLLAEARLRGRLPLLGSNFFTGDSLAAPPGSEDAGPQDVNWTSVLRRRGTFQIILANPPFGSQRTQGSRRDETERARVRESFPEARDWGVDEAYFFLALGLRLAGADSALGYVLPRAWLSGRSAVKSRAGVAKRVVSITDFRGMQLFPDAQSYVATVVLGATDAEILLTEIVDSRADVALTLERLEDECLGQEDSRHGDDFRRLQISRPRLYATASRGWTPFALRLEDLRRLIGREYDAFAPDSGKGGDRIVVQGTQPGDLKRLLISPTPGTERVTEVQVEGILVPVAYVPKLLRGRDIHTLRAEWAGERLFVPFDANRGPSKHPRVQEALRALGGAPRHAQPGDLSLLRGPKVIVRAFGKTLAAVADPNAEWMITKGTGGGLALGGPEVQAVGVDAVAALLNSAVYQWLLRGSGQPRRDETIEILVRDVARLPWPHLSIEEWRQLRDAGRAAAASLALSQETRTDAFLAAIRDLDELVYSLLMVASELRQTIGSELIREL
jgi:SAM-dependent methyltransferase